MIDGSFGEKCILLQYLSLSKYSFSTYSLVNILSNDIPLMGLSLDKVEIQSFIERFCFKGFVSKFLLYKWKSSKNFKLQQQQQQQ